MHKDTVHDRITGCTGCHALIVQFLMVIFMMVLHAEPRLAVGTDESRRLRKQQGRVPGVIYARKLGGGTECVHISLESSGLVREYRKKHMIGRIFEIQLNDTKTQVVLYDITFHPVTGLLEHIEFNAVCDGEIIAKVPVVFHNHSTCTPVKRGGFLNVLRRSITLSCKIEDYSEQIRVNLQDAEVGQAYKVSDLPLPKGYKLRDCSERTLVARFMGKKSSGQKQDAEGEGSAVAAAPAKASAKK